MRKIRKNLDKIKAIVETPYSRTTTKAENIAGMMNLLIIMIPIYKL